LTFSIRIAAVASISSLALVAASTVTASAAPNPNNHGHHYGQLKHPKVTTPPPPVPAPTPHPVATPSAVPVTHTPPAGIVSAVPIQQPAPASKAPDTVASPLSPVIQLSQAADPAGQYDWLLLVLLPTLLAIWLIALVGLVRRLSGARKKMLQVQTAPA
jgi:hypothetical protein